MSGEIELNRRYFCREEMSGEGYCGLFYIDDDGIYALLFSIEKYFGVAAEELLVLRLEDNRFASLHNSISSPTGSAIDYREPKMSTYSQRVISNVAVVGRSPWLAADPILRVQFSVEHADDLLLYPKKFDAIADAEFGMVDDSQIFEVHAGDLKVSAWYALSGTMHLRRPSKIEVRYTLEFSVPKTLDTYLEPIDSVLRFISAALGSRFVPSDIQISALNQAMLMKAVGDKTYLGDHAIHYIWRGKIPDKRDLWIGHSFVHARDDDELAALVACLKMWIERDGAWRNATSLMMRALSLEHEMSAERLLTACKWLEEIPGAASELAVSDEDIDKIAIVAAAEADRLKHSEFKDRIAGVIRGQLKSETNAERFTRLTDSICARFGSVALDNGIVNHLVAAMKYRGKVAHGHFDPVDEAEYKAFAKATYAMESLCYLLTIRDLPMTQAGVKRALGRPIASNYRN